MDVPEKRHSMMVLQFQNLHRIEFAKLRAMRAMRAQVLKACQHFIFLCEHAKDVSFFKLACQRARSVPTFYFQEPTCQSAKDVPFSNGVPRCQKVCQFFNYFSKEKMFQLSLTFANFKNTWAILENLSREAKNLKQSFLTFACFSYAHQKSF